MKSKKSEAGTVIIIVIILALFFGWLINLNQRECRSNKDCKSESYCGSDFACHEFPVIQKTIVQYNFLWPSIIIGLAVIFAAIILKWNDIKPMFEREHMQDDNEGADSKVSEDEEPEEYYKTETKTP